jgi:hypothetical protein
MVGGAYGSSFGMPSVNPSNVVTSNSVYTPGLTANAGFSNYQTVPAAAAAPMM